MKREFELPPEKPLSPSLRTSGCSCPEGSWTDRFGIQEKSLKWTQRVAHPPSGSVCVLVTAVGFGRKSGGLGVDRMRRQEG